MAVPCILRFAILATQALCKERTAYEWDALALTLYCPNLDGTYPRSKAISNRDDNESGQASSSGPAKSHNRRSEYGENTDIVMTVTVCQMTRQNSADQRGGVQSRDKVERVFRRHPFCGCKRGDVKERNEET